MKVEAESRHFDRRGVNLATMLFGGLERLSEHAASSLPRGTSDPAIRVHAREDVIELVELSGVAAAHGSIEALC